MGGAKSHDIEDGILDPCDPDYREKRKALRKRNANFRVLHENWWPDEMPTDAEYKEALKSLNDASQKDNVEQLIYVSNIPDPFNNPPTSSLFGNETHVSFNELPESCKQKIEETAEKIPALLPGFHGAPD